MKLYRRYNIWIIESSFFIQLAGYISAGKTVAKKAKAAAFWPFIFVRDESCVTPLFINHERIHFRQQIETLFVGLLLLTLYEMIYTKYVLRLPPEERYLWRASEQEAYRNQHNFNYLAERKLFAVFLYLKNKKHVSFVANRPPEVIVSDPAKQ
jgi:hypothetical protein